MRSNTFRIHIIDDNEVSRSYLKLIVNRACINSEILVFEQAELSINEIEGDQFPDLVFCDLNMPKMDGKEYLLKLGEILSAKNIHLFPVVIVTSANEAMVESKFANIYKNTEVFIKPLLFNQVSDLLQKLGIVQKQVDPNND